jgi:hypothetical protein
VKCFNCQKEFTTRKNTSKRSRPGTYCSSSCWRNSSDIKRTLSRYRPKSTGLCTVCRIRRPENPKESRCNQCHARQTRDARARPYKTVFVRNGKSLRRITTLRQQVLRFYSRTFIPRCACCAEDEQRFLTLDHVNNDGYKDRSISTASLYKRLVKLGFPDGYKVLCSNCNSGRALNGGVCPHVQSVTGKSTKSALLILPTAFALKKSKLRSVFQ